MQFVIVTPVLVTFFIFFIGLYAQIIASYSFAVNPFLNLTTQLD
jgi:nucleoside recognition membrane protein YjiH